jgi:SAM-dependent methyltransferase
VTPNTDTGTDVVSPHYLGDRGANYCEGYSGNAPAMAGVKARSFRPFLSGTDTVLDFGCASGEVLMELPCARRLGVEVNPTFLSRARAKGIETFGAVGDVPAGSVDVVISGHALEHCLRPLDELRGLRAVLKAGGRLVLILPLDDWRVQRQFRVPDPNHHLYTWTPLLLGNLLTEAGFSIESIRVLTQAWPPRGAYQLWRLLPHWLFDGMGVAFSVLQRRRQLQAVAVRQ